LKHDTARRSLTFLVNRFACLLLRLLNELGLKTARHIRQNTFLSPDMRIKVSVFRSIEILRSCGWTGSRPSLGLKAIRKEDSARSEILNIVGSGASLNRLSPAEQGYLASSDTMTFNFSHLAELKPTYALLQSPLERYRGFEDDDKKTWNQINHLTIESLVSRSEQFQDTCFILRPTSTIFARRRKGSIKIAVERTFGSHKIAKLNIINVAAPFEDSIADLCSRNSETFHNFDQQVFTLKLGSSLPMAIVVGLQLGYKKICLFGCDLLDARHFYDTNYYVERYNGLLNYPAVWVQDSSASIIDLLVDTTIRKTSQIEDVSELAVWLRDTLGVEVRIVNDDTAFFGHLEIADEEWLNQQD
jgi:hypothetical protein